jgi:uncharacterized membrane protein YidH (DUF202 family)
MATDGQSEKLPTRPVHITFGPLPPLPDVNGMTDGQTSTALSGHRTGLSRHRTELSEHRTDLSEFRTDLSQFRTGLSENRTELSMRRTGMSIHRTRMSADRTLMSVLRTSLSMIGFGFTLYQTFKKLNEANVIHNSAAPRNFGLLLIILGIVVLIGGIYNQIHFAIELRGIRKALVDEKLIHGQTDYPLSLALLAAVALLLIGIVAVLSIVFGYSLFG